MAEEREKDAGRKDPLPLGPFTAIAVMYFTNSLAQTVLFPFAAIMVRSFNVTDDDTKLGYYAGALASAVFAGSLLTASIWGVLADKVGRKPVLITGLVGNLVCGLIFGTSRSFHQAMLARFINGVFNTIVSVGRTTVSELCTERNQPDGFAIVGVSFGAGLLIGPALGGFLCEPAMKYPALFPAGSFFDYYPFLLPLLTLAVMTSFGLISSLLFLPETLGMARKKEEAAKGERLLIRKESLKRFEERNSLIPGAERSRVGESDRAFKTNGHTADNGADEDDREDEGESSRRPLLTQSPSQKWRRLSLDEEEEERIRNMNGIQGLLKKSLSKERESPEVRQLEEGGQRKPVLEKEELEWEEAPKEVKIFTAEFARVLFARDTVLAAVIFALCSFTFTSFNEVFPLWCISPWDLGGLSFGTNQIALAQTASGIAAIPLQMFVYSPLVHRAGPIFALQSAVIVGMLLLFFPVVRLLPPGSWRLQLSTAFFMALRSYPGCIFTSIFILIANSVAEPKFLGAVNGFTQTLNMFFRALAPIASGSFYAWTASQGTVLFNAYSWLYFIGLLYMAILVCSCFMSPEAETRKFVTQEEEKLEQLLESNSLKH